MSDLKLVIFDVDGTLIDSQAHILAAMAHAFDGVGLSLPPRETVLAGVGLSLPVLIDRLVPQADVATQTAIVEGYKSGFAKLRLADGKALSPLFPGARDALDRLHAKDDVLLAVATGKSRRGMDHLLDMHGLRGMFQSVQVADDHPSKPAPSMIHTCLSDTGVSPENAVMIGDTVFDIDMAANGGIGAIGVDWGYHDASALAASGAADVISEFDALEHALTRFWS